jgi:DNA primase
MARFSKDSVDRVKDAADMVEVVSAHTDLRQRGKDWWGLCPFHDESTPSFKVNPLDKLYYCFGCEASGDVFSFIEEKEGLSFPEAVESVAERYGVELEREAEDPRAEAARRRKARLYELLDRTSQFYVKYLWEGEKREAVKAREYLAERGLEEAALRRFGVGFAPNRWDAVLLGGQSAGFKLEELFDAGLLRRNKRGPYDYFRQRIMFPIRDQRGRVIGFGARAQRPDEKAKYVNSPEGDLYRKGHLLYGIDLARSAIAKAKRAIVVEGYTDVIALHQAGVEEVVAIMGTAITPEQLKTLSGLTETVVLALDADRAGADAMIRAQRVAGDRGMDLRVAAMPEDADPADMLAGGQIERFRELVAGAIDLPSFRVRTALGRAELGSVAGRERALAEVAPVLQTLGEKTVGRDELVREVANKLDTDPSLVSERVRTAKPLQEIVTAPAGADDPTPVAERAPLTPREARERALLAMCISDPKRGKEFIERLREEHMSSSAAPALAWLRDHLDDPAGGLPRDDQALTSLITELVMTAEQEPASEGAMELNFMLLEQERLEKGITAAQEAGADDERARLIRERAELRDRISHAESIGA